MKTLSADAQSDIIKLTGGQAWVEVIDIALPEDYESSASEDTFLAIAPDSSKHILVCKGFNNDKIVMRVAGWQTTGHAAGLKVFWSVPYERDDIEDSSDKRGAVNTRITIGDAGNTIGSIMDKTDGMIGLGVSIGMALVDHDDALTVADGTIVVFEPDILYDFVVNAATHDGINFSVTLAIDTPLEWKYPENAMLKNVCPFKYGGPECGYKGIMRKKVLTTANGSLDNGIKLFNDWGFVIFGPTVTHGEGYVACVNGAMQRLPDERTPGEVYAPPVETIPITSDKNVRHLVETHECIYYIDGSYLKRYDSTELTTSIVSGVDASEISGIPDKRRISAGRSDNDCYFISATQRKLYHVVGEIASEAFLSPTYFNDVKTSDEYGCFAIQGTSLNVLSGALLYIKNGNVDASNSEKAWSEIIELWEDYTVIVRAGNELYRCSYYGAEITITQIVDENDVAINLSTLVADTSLEQSGSYLVGKFVVSGEQVGKIFKYEETLGVPRLVEKHAGITSWEYISLARVSPLVHASIGSSKIYIITDESASPVADLPIGRIDAFVAVTESVFYVVITGIIYFIDISLTTETFPCLHTLSSCKEHGNETRFGGFPGIGAGGLMQ